MKKLVVLCLAAFIALGAGLALAKAIKFNLVPPPDNSVYAGASGQAVLNYVKGTNKTEIQVQCWGLLPTTTYHIHLIFGLGINQSVGNFTTSKNGNGNYRISLPEDKATEVAYVGIWDGSSYVLINQ